LERARRADADQPTHEEPEIETARVNQQPLPTVGVTAEVHAAHATGLIEMGKRSFRAFTAEPQEAQAACPANSATIAVHRAARFWMPPPVASPTIGLGDVTANADGFEVDQRLVAVSPSTYRSKSCWSRI